MGDEGRKIYLHDCDECHEPIKDRRILCGACDDPDFRARALESTLERAYYLGCIVGAAIVAWGDAMREREEAKRRERDWEDRRLEEDMGG